MPNELVDLSSVVDGYDADEDWSVDRMYDEYGTCFDCGDIDSGWCRCLVMMDDVERWGISPARVLVHYRMEALAMENARKARWIRRKARLNLRKWKDSVTMTSVTMFWLHVTHSPDSSCAKRAKTRFYSSLALVAS